MTNEQRLSHLETQLAETNQRLDTQLAELRQQQEINTNSIVGLNQAVQGLIDVVRIDREIARETNIRVEAEMGEMRSEMREMQVEMREMRSEIRGIQLECQRIWEYLLSQQGNGNRPG